MKKLNVLFVGLIFLCLVNTAAAAMMPMEGAAPYEDGDCGAIWNGNINWYAQDWLENCYFVMSIGMEV